MKLAEFLAEYLEDVAEKNINGRIPLTGLEEIIQAGIEAYYKEAPISVTVRKPDGTIRGHSLGCACDGCES